MSYSLTSKALSEQNYQVRVAKTGNGGRTSCQLRPQDLILLELHLPDQAGYDVYTSLKENPPTKDIPIICLSSSHESLGKDQSLALGAVDFIMKPFITWNYWQDFQRI